MPTADERKIIRFSPVCIRVRAAASKGSTFLGQISGFFRPEKEDLVFRSSLGEGHSINEHLKWMYGLVGCEGAYFKRARQEGFDIVLQIFAEAQEFDLAPEAFLLPHKLQLPVEVYFQK